MKRSVTCRRLAVVVTAVALAAVGVTGVIAAQARAAATARRPPRHTRRGRGHVPAVPGVAHRQVGAAPQGRPHRAQPRERQQLVFFGGSRSQRFDPVFARQRTGLRAVNISLSCARPEAAWGYLNWFYSRWPDAKIRWVWGMQSGMLRDRDLDPALLQDRRFYPYFPDDLLARQRAQLPDSAAGMPHGYGFLRNRYSHRGLLLWNRYDQRRTDGYTLHQALDAYIARMLHTGRTATEPDTRARAYFEDTISLLNDHGTTPVIVLMPIHPRVLRVMKQHDMGGERERLRDYLAALGETLSIKVLDFTTIRSFNGKADWFYDGVHITRRNADRVIVAAKGKAGEYLR